MNVFATNPDPVTSAKSLPDRHVCKMIVETCQILAYVHHHRGWPPILRKDGGPYKVTGSHARHPCTIWTQNDLRNHAWLIRHGQALLDEYHYRYGGLHGCSRALEEAPKTFTEAVGTPPVLLGPPEAFVRAMPAQWAHDTTIDDHEAYRAYLGSKAWVPDNYLRRPERKPSWLKTP